MFREDQQIGLYTLISKLGKGGFGEVWLAERKSKFVTTKVAVKLPLDEQVDHEAIRQEATLWEQASGHPNILPIIDADEYDGQVVIVSEYAPDGSLEQWLKTHGKMPVEKAVETTIQILDGLEFLHSRNIIHRDLKPANILLQGKTPRLADFGISRAMRTTVASQSQYISGTFAYMSPEALDGKRSIQTDVWSVGVNLYQFLTGTLPFPHKEPSVLFPAIIMREFANLPDSIPQNLQGIVAKALAKLPENRYASAGEMREVLKKVLVNVSFPQFAPTELLPKEILSEIITAPVTIENENETSEAENETIIAAKPENHLTATKPSYPQDSIAARTKEENSVATQISAMKAETASQILPTEARAFADRTYGRKNNNLFFTLIGAGVLFAIVLIGVVSYNLSKSGGTTANTNTSGTTTNANGNTTANVANKKTNTVANNSEVRKNSIGMEFVHIPAGEFMMGGDEYADTKPIHKVTISKGFWMGKTEVTQTQWQAVMGSNPSNFKGDNLPVENVSWDDAQEFIKKLNVKGEGTYRLPTEAEWEYAARSGTTGDYAGNLDAVAWYDKNSGNETHEVATKQANSWDLYDMYGNVWEWCSDWYEVYSSSARKDPTGATSGSNRVFRGGSWANDAVGLRYRSKSSTSVRSYGLGFRVVRQ